MISADKNIERWHVHFISKALKKIATMNNKNINLIKSKVLVYAN